MKVTFINSYPVLNEDKTVKKDKNGEPIISYKYRWHGTKAELEKYESIQGEHFRKDTVGPLYFTPFYIGETCELHISTNGKLYADTSLLDAAKSLIKQHGELGKMLAIDLLKNGFSAKRESPVGETVTEDDNTPLVPE